MNIKILFNQFLTTTLVLSFLIPSSNIALAREKKKTQSNNGDVQAATNATHDLVNSLDANNSTPIAVNAPAVAETIVSSGSGVIKTPAEIEAERAKRRALAAQKLKKDIKEQGDYINGRMKLLSDNQNAAWIFKTSVDSIKAVFKEGEINTEAEMIRTLKQTACVFIAETRYGNLEDNGVFDKCDQTNIGQIRPPAYKAIYDRCQVDFSPNDLQFLAKGTTCDTLHPYELPLCCNAIISGESTVNCSPKSKVSGRGRKKRYSVDESQINNPRFCVSKAKRDFLENADFMSATSMANPDIDDGRVDAISCLSTSGDEYVRVPAFPEHSVFAGIYYLKIVGYEPMSDADFASFGANRYNGAGAKERRGYQRKLNACLEVLNRPENSDIIKQAYKRAIETRSLADTNMAKFENSPKADSLKDEDDNAIIEPSGVRLYKIKQPTKINAENLQSSAYMRALQGHSNDGGQSSTGGR